MDQYAIIGTGLTGLIGSRVRELLSPQFPMSDMRSDLGVDLSDNLSVRRVLSGSHWSACFHFAAKTNVDTAEAEKDRTDGEFWNVNVNLTAALADACHDQGIRLVYLSTDYVFDGRKAFYTEDDTPNPQSWYAVTKYEGEKAVLRYPEHIVVRTSNPYRANPVGKTDFVHKIKHVLAEGKQVFSPDTQIFVPTFVDDIAEGLRLIISDTVSGIFHIVGGEAMTPYDASLEIARVFGYDESLVRPIGYEDFIRGRARRPVRAVLKHGKITQLGLVPMGFHDGLMTVVKQESYRI